MGAGPIFGQKAKLSRGLVYRQVHFEFAGLGRTLYCALRQSDHTALLPRFLLQPVPMFCQRTK